MNFEDATMEKNDKIPIRNIYYMLSYAYQSLHLSEYRDMGTENFENTQELYAEILSIGIPVLIRGGLHKDYISFHDTSTVIKGKMDINSSIKRNSLLGKKMSIIYDEFSEDILLNQIMKATILYLSRSNKICHKNRKLFHGLLPYFSMVSDLPLQLSLWSGVRYNRQNIRYQFILDVCRYLFEELLFDENTASLELRELQDKQRLSSLFEKFIYAFFKKETEYAVSRPQITWQVDDEFTEALPIMQTDLVLKNNSKTLIIDTKFYTENMSAKFEGSTMKHKSGNLYQVFTYVNNWNKNPEETVAGMLLYAKTTAEVQPNHIYKIKGNKFYVVSIDLQDDFSSIKENLIYYANDYLS